MAEKPTHEEINQKEMLTKASLAQWQTTFDAINDAVCLLDMNGKILRCNKAMESLLKKSSEEIIGSTCWELVHGTEQSLQEAEAELRHTIEVVPGIIAKANAHTGYFTHCNPALSSILGFSSEEFLTRPFIEFIHPDDRQSTIIEVEKQLKGSPLAIFENRYICKNGSYKWLEWRATAAGEKGVVYAAATDITEHKKLEDELRLRAAMMDNVAEGVYLIGLDDFLIKWTSEKFTRMFGYDPGEMLGKNVDIVNAPTERTPAETRISIMNVLKETGEWHGEVRNIKRDGTHFWCSANVSLFDHPEYGKVMVSVHADITERKQTEKKLQERMSELETFYRATLGREERVIELKQEVNELLEQLGKNKKYGDYGK